MIEENFTNISKHLKISGFIFPGSQIYGGLSNSWDYGPLGILLKNNIRDKWINTFVKNIPDCVLIDSSILLNSKIWHASGHVNKFSDPLIDCKNCKNRYRADELIEKQLQIDFKLIKINEIEDKLKLIKCPNCNKSHFTNIRNFNLMFETYQGVIDNKKSPIYLRPETAQGIFINFKNVQRSMRLKLPFGIAQIGKAFRNEITPSHLIFRTREFEQMELEYFIYPENNIESYNYLINSSYIFIKGLGINSDKLRLKNIDKESLAHYSLANSDIEYKFPFGWGEIAGISQRGDFDLSSHQKSSGENLTYFDTKKNQKILPFVIEPTFGLSRLVLAVLVDSYNDIINDKSRVVMKISYELAPYKVAILPLVKKLSQPAKDIFMELNNHISVVFDDSGSIGKRYVKQDMIGTPFCITYDYDSLNDNKVTIRNRDTMLQDRVLIKNISKYINDYEW